MVVRFIGLVASRQAFTEGVVCATPNQTGQGSDQDGDVTLDSSALQPLVVDLRDEVIESTDQLWDLLGSPCGLPAWFGRNLDAWVDTLHGGISDAIDQRPLMIIRVRPRGLFSPGNERGSAVIEITNESGRARVEVVDE
jgi:RNAse (barnase) inhibitor barstar